MLKLSIGILSFILLAGCQMAQRREYVASCPNMDVPLSCTIDYTRPGCGTANQAVESCSRFIDRNIKAQEARQAQAQGSTTGEYENPGAQKLLLGFEGEPTSKRAVYADASRLDVYVRSVDLAKALMASKIERYQSAMRAYSSLRATGQKADFRAVEVAYSELQSLVGPLLTASEQGQPISRFYEKKPSFDYELANMHFTSQFGNRNDVLREGWLRANRKHRAAQPFPPEVLAVVSVAQFRSMASDISTRWPQTYSQDKVKADQAAADYQRQKVRAAAARERERHYHETYQAPSQPRESTGYSGGGCSCSGGNVCYGPRGGRYCITSGGNKRYGI